MKRKHGTLKVVVESTQPFEDLRLRLFELIADPFELGDEEDFDRDLYTKELFENKLLQRMLSCPMFEVSYEPPPSHRESGHNVVTMAIKYRRMTLLKGLVEKNGPQILTLAASRAGSPMSSLVSLVIRNEPYLRPATSNGPDSLSDFWPFYDMIMQQDSNAVNVLQKRQYGMFESLLFSLISHRLAGRGKKTLRQRIEEKKMAMPDNVAPDWRDPLILRMLQDGGLIYPLPLLADSAHTWDAYQNLETLLSDFLVNALIHICRDYLEEGYFYFLASRKDVEGGSLIPFSNQQHVSLNWEPYLRYLSKELKGL